MTRLWLSSTAALISILAVPVFYPPHRSANIG